MEVNEEKEEEVEGPPPKLNPLSPVEAGTVETDPNEKASPTEGEGEVLGAFDVEDEE